MRVLLSWAAALSLWSLSTVALTQWPVTEYDLARTAYVAIWACWGWLPVTLAYATLRSARALRALARRSLDTTLPTWCASLVDASASAILTYLDQQTFSLVQRRQQAEDLVNL